MFEMNRKPTSVGEMLTEEFLEPHGLSQSDLAKLMSVKPGHVNELCRDRRAVTADTALMLSTVFGTSPEFWMNLQQKVDLWDALHNEKSRRRVERVRPLEQA